MESEVHVLRRPAAGLITTGLVLVVLAFAAGLLAVHESILLTTVPDLQWGPDGYRGNNAPFYGVAAAALLVGGLVPLARGVHRLVDRDDRRSSPVTDWPERLEVDPQSVGTVSRPGDAAAPDALAAGASGTSTPGAPPAPPSP